MAYELWYVNHYTHNLYGCVYKIFIQYLIIIKTDAGNSNGQRGKQYNGHWQLSKRVHKRKGYELNGINFCIQRNLDLKIFKEPEEHLFMLTSIFILLLAVTNATSLLGYPVGRYEWQIDYEPKCGIFEPTNVTLTLSRCREVNKVVIIFQFKVIMFFTSKSRDFTRNSFHIFLGE